MKLALSPHAYRQYRKLPPSLAKLIKKCLTDLATDPYPPQSKKLTGRPGHRLRYGDYRIIYQVDSKAKSIIILAIAHRRQIYR